MPYASAPLIELRSEDDIPEDWEEKVSEDPEVIDLPGLGEQAPEDPDAPVPPVTDDDVPETWDEKVLEDQLEEEQDEPLPPS